MALADLKVVAVPCNRILHDLPVHAGIAAELVLSGPLLKVEEIAEELEAFGLVEQPQPKRAAKMAFKNRRRLLKVGQHPRCVGGVLLRLALKRLDLRRLQREAPMQVDARGSPLSSQGMQDGRSRIPAVTGFAYLAWRGRSKPDMTRVY